MKRGSILGIDTATPMAAAGVMREGRVSSEVCELSRHGHAALLPDLVRKALDEAETRPADLDAIAVSVGPGSFTGLRIGLSFAKGMAYSAGVSLVGVDTLEALARLAPSGSPRIAAATDARKGEVYLGFFRRTPDGVERTAADVAATPDEAARRIGEEFGDQGVVVGDAAEAHPDAFRWLRDGSIVLVPFAEIHPRGSTVAALGAERLAAGAETGAERLLPRYVRASAAEVNRERILQGSPSLTTKGTVS